MQDQISLTLRGRSLLGGGSDIVAANLTHNGGQHFDYSIMSSHSCLISKMQEQKLLTLR